MSPGRPQVALPSRPTHTAALCRVVLAEHRRHFLRCLRCFVPAQDQPRRLQPICRASRRLPDSAHQLWQRAGFSRRLNASVESHCHRLLMLLLPMLLVVLVASSRCRSARQPYVRPGCAHSRLSYRAHSPRCAPVAVTARDE